MRKKQRVMLGAVDCLDPPRRRREPNKPIDVETAKAVLHRIYRNAVRTDFISNGVTWKCLQYNGQPRRHYPTITIANRSYLMHRIVLTAKLGRPLTMLALHRCDNPKCVDDEHLYEGTTAQNTADAFARNRRFPPRLLDPLILKRIVGSVIPPRFAYRFGLCPDTVRKYRRAANCDLFRWRSAKPDRHGHDDQRQLSLLLPSS